MRRLYLRDCVSGDLIDDVLVMTNKQFAATSNGKYYIKAFVSDRTAQLTARFWNATRDIFNALPDGGFVHLRGRIENYQNNLQFIIEQALAAREGSFEAGDLIPQTSRDIPQMSVRLAEILQSIQNRHLAAIIQAYLDDRELMERFARAPAAMSFHHAFIGGLLEHTLNSIEVADAVVRFYPGLNRDLVVAGIFLHDIAKTWELSYDCSFGYTDAGQLVGHIVKSAIWVEQKAAAAELVLGEKIPRPLVDVLQHLILAHHGTAEFGSPRLPATPEAIAVHAIENMDAKLMMSLSATRGETQAGAEGNWTEYMKAMSTRMYRPDVAPADAAETEVLELDEPTPPASEVVPNSPRPAAAPMTITNPLFEKSPAKKK